MNLIEDYFLEDIFEGILRGLFRFIVYIFHDVVIEIFIKGTGYLIVRCYKRKSNIDPDGIEVAAWGIFFWISIITITIMI